MKTVKTHNLKIALRVDSGLSMGHVYALNNSGRTLMGRRVDAHIPVDDRKVSREHAAIDARSGFFHIADLGSTNGTFINDQKVQGSVIVKVGDRIRLGNAVFVVEPLEKATHNSGQEKTWAEPTTLILRDSIEKQLADQQVISAGRKGLHNPRHSWAHHALEWTREEKAKFYGQIIMLITAGILLTVALMK